MSVAELTSTTIDAAGIGSIPKGNSAPPKTKGPPANSAYDARADRTDSASTYNSTPSEPEKSSTDPKQDFGQELEQQIRKGSPQDDQPAGGIRSDRGESVTTKKTGETQQSANETLPAYVQEMVQVSVPKKDGSPVALEAGQGESVKARPKLALTTSTKSEAPDTLPEQAEGTKQAATEGNVVDKIIDIPDPERGQVEAKQPLQKASRIPSSNENTVSVPVKATPTQVSKDNPQQNQPQQSVSAAKASPTADQSQTPKADVQEIAVSADDSAKVNGTDAKPPIQEPRVQQHTDYSGVEKQSNTAGLKGDMEDSVGSDLSEAESRQPQNKASVPVENRAVQTPAVAAASTPISQTIKRSGAVAKDDAESGSGRVIPQGATPASSSRSASPVAQVAKPVGGNAATGDSAAVSQQIQESFSTAVHQGDQQITIRLNPPELGSVQMSIREQGDQITGLLEVSEMQTRAEIQQALPQIVRNLQDMGINVKRLDVTLVTEQDHHASTGQSMAGQKENWTGADGSRNGGTQAEGSNWAATEWLPGSDGYADARDAYGSYVTDTSINMLV